MWMTFYRTKALPLMVEDQGLPCLRNKYNYIEQVKYIVEKYPFLLSYNIDEERFCETRTNR